MKNNIYLEHVNITVSNLDSSIEFIKTAFPTFDIRGGGTSNGKKWIHIGDDITYFAINESIEGKLSHEKAYDRNGINHIGFVVEDVNEIAERLLENGYRRDYPKQVEKYRIRDYFIDKDGNEYEFVQYLTDDLKLRNSFDA